MTLQNYVKRKMASADKAADAEGYPLTLENCKKYKPMRDLKVYGNSVQDGTPSPDNPIEVQSVGELVTDETDSNYGKYKIPVITCGKNLYSPYDIYARNSYKKVTEDGRECIRFDTSLGSWFAGRGFRENTGYSVSFYCKTTIADGYTSSNIAYDVPFAFTYTDGSDTRGIVRRDGSWHKVTLTSDDGKTVRAIGCPSHDYRQWNYIDVNSFQIEESAVATEYEPYVEPITTNVFLDEPLRKLGDYADYIDFKNNKIVRKNYKQVLNSSMSAGAAVQAWQREGHYACVCDSVLEVAGVRDVIAYSNRSNFGNWTWSGNSFPGNYFYQAQNDKNLHVIINEQYLDGITNESTNAEKVAAVKAFFDKYETYLLYPRKTPKEEPIDIDLPKLNAKTTIIEVDTSLLPSNVYGKYIKK